MDGTFKKVPLFRKVQLQDALFITQKLHQAAFKWITFPRSC
jgi:hypothetical protein